MPIATSLAIGYAITAAGVGLQAYGQHKAGKAAKQAGAAQQAAAESEAEVAEYNAAVARLQGRDAIARGAEAESKFRTQVRGLIGGQRAGIAAGNIDVGFGSAVDVQADAAYLGELDALTLRTNAAREAWGYDVQATDLLKRATIARKTGDYAAQAGRAAATTANLETLGTIATSASSLLLNRYGFSGGGGGRTKAAPTLEARGDAIPGGAYG